MSTAELGLVIDSSPAAKAAVDLDALVPAAGRAESAVEKLGQGATASMTRMGQQIEAAVSRARNEMGRMGATPTTSYLTSQQINSALNVRDSFGGAGRSADIVAYGKALDDLRAKYNPLYAASKQYETELNDLDSALKVGAITSAEHGAALERMNFRYANLGGVADVAGKKFAGLSFEARNLGFQLIDVTQGALSGQSAFMIFAQQAGQIGQIIAFSDKGLGGMLKELGKAFSGLLTPMRLLGVGAAAAGVAVYAANAIWKSSALELDNVARAAGTTVGQIRALQAVAEGKGIDNFGDSAKQFASAIYSARNSMGSLADLLQMNGERATDFAGTMEAVSRIIQRTRSDQQALHLLQQAGLPATMEWVRLLRQGPDAIAKAVDESNNLSAKEQELIDKARQFDERWATGWANFKKNAFDAITEVKSDLQKLIDKLEEYEKRAGKFVGDTLGGGLTSIPLENALKGNMRPRISIDVPAAPPMPRPRPSDAIDPVVAREAISREQQRLGILNQMLTVEQQELVVRKQLELAGLNHIHITTTEAENLLRLARERALGIDQIKAQKDAYDVEAATVGMSVGQAAAYAAVQNKINEYKRLGIPLTAENIAAIQREANAMGAAAQRADDMNFRFQTFSGMMRDIGANLRQGQKFWDAFGNAAANALNKITDRLLDMAARDLWNAAFPSGGGGGSGGGLMSWITSFFSGAGHNANGTDNWRGGLTWVGEKGPELVNLPSGAQVIPNNKLGGVMGAVANGNIIIQVNNAPADTTATATRSRGPNGEPSIAITLRRTQDANNADLLASGESATNRALERRYGLVPLL